MIDFGRHAYIAETVKQLREVESWTGKTHVQKTLALVDLIRSTPFTFVLYKHGPYSFDVDSEIEQMRSYDAVVSQEFGGYGPRLKIGPGAKFIDAEASVDESMRKTIRAAAKFAGGRGVADLERTVTAVWIARKEGLSDGERIAQRLRSLKPHVPVQEAEEAAKEALAFVRKELASKS